MSENWKTTCNNFTKTSSRNLKVHNCITRPRPEAGNTNWGCLGRSGQCWCFGPHRHPLHDWGVEVLPVDPPRQSCSAWRALGWTEMKTKGFWITALRTPRSTEMKFEGFRGINCLLYTSPSPRDYAASRMPSSA